MGLVGPDSTCLIQGFQGGEDNTFKFPLMFSAVTDTTTAVVIEAFVNGTSVYNQRISPVSDLIITTTCRNEAETYLIGNKTVETTAGCSGEFLYLISGPLADTCNPATNPYNKCEFNVNTLNCAFVLSEVLVLEPLTSSTVISYPPEAADILIERLASDTEKIESTFYYLFKLIGMAALIEFYFTVFGILLKLIFLSECRTAKMDRTKLFKKRTTVMFEVVDNGDVIPNDQVLNEISEQPEGDPVVESKESEGVYPQVN